jgi:ABC-type sugar transport system ATPase subunit
MCAPGTEETVMVVASAPPALLTINDVSKAFPGVKALDHVTLEVRPGVVP